jgi:hypothetical protein
VADFSAIKPMAEICCPEERVAVGRSASSSAMGPSFHPLDGVELLQMSAW